MLLVFCSLKTKDKLHIHSRRDTYTKSSRAKSFIIQLSWKYYMENFEEKLRTNINSRQNLNILYYMQVLNKVFVVTFM